MLMIWVDLDILMWIPTNLTLSSSITARITYRVYIVERRQCKEPPIPQPAVRHLTGPRPHPPWQLPVQETNGGGDRHISDRPPPPSRPQRTKTHKEIEGNATKRAAHGADRRQPNRREDFGENAMILDYLDARDKQKLVSMGYSIIRKLGEGSFSKVYLAAYANIKNQEKREFPRDQQVRLAVKLIDKEALPEDTLCYLDSEIHFLASLSHPHIIHVHSVLRRANLYLIFMRHAEYGNLCNFLQTYGSLKEKFARIWTRQIALALSYLHYLEIAHRGVKCENILVTANNNVKLSDFGFARFTENVFGLPVECTTFCGTLPYAAPEIIRGRTPYDGKLADIWSLGVVLYVMLNKCLPFKTENLAALWTDQVKQNFRFLPEVRAAVTPEAVIVTELLLQPNPKERLPLESLLKSKWMAQDPPLLESSLPEKLAMKQAEKVKETIMPKKIRVHDEDEKLFTEEDAEYRALVEKDPCDIEVVQKVNRGTYTYNILPL